MRKTVALISFVVLIIACNKEQDLTPQAQFLESGYAGFFGDCFNTVRFNEEVVIRNQEEYEAYFKDKINEHNSSKQCGLADLPAINFKKYTLLGHSLGMSGCSREISRTIQQVKRNHLVYSIDVIERGGCKPLIVDMNWALVPRINKRTEVEFITHIEQEY
jgi:hypothetical protein